MILTGSQCTWVCLWNSSNDSLRHIQEPPQENGGRSQASIIGSASSGRRRQTWIDDGEFGSERGGS